MGEIKEVKEQQNVKFNEMNTNLRGDINDMKQQHVKFQDNINKSLSAFEEKLNSRLSAGEKQIREYKFTWGYKKENKESELNQVSDFDSGGNYEDNLTNHADSLSANKVIDDKVSDCLLYTSRCV